VIDDEIEISSDIELLGAFLLRLRDENAVAQYDYTTNLIYETHGKIILFAAQEHEQRLICARNGQ
jgi:hypothetical protein